jgi:hypothetical protein
MALKMISKTEVDLDKEILKRIQDSRIDFDKKEQRTELLKRNERFLNELNGIKDRLGQKFFKVRNISNKTIRQISDDNPLLKMDYPKLKFILLKSKDETEKQFKTRCFVSA